jgi:hypothetical protein
MTSIPIKPWPCEGGHWRVSKQSLPPCVLCERRVPELTCGGPSHEPTCESVHGQWICRNRVPAFDSLGA